MMMMMKVVLPLVKSHLEIDGKEEDAKMMMMKKKKPFHLLVDGWLLYSQRHFHFLRYVQHHQQSDYW
jgi:hypothetical protein